MEIIQIKTALKLDLRTKSGYKYRLKLCMSMLLCVINCVA